jgi:hypothetical protein
MSLLFTICQAVVKHWIELTLPPRFLGAEPLLAPSCLAEARRRGTAQQLVAALQRGLRDSSPLMFGRYLKQGCQRGDNCGKQLAMLTLCAVEKDLALSERSPSNGQTSCIVCRLKRLEIFSRWPIVANVFCFSLPL